METPCEFPNAIPKYHDEECEPATRENEACVGPTNSEVDADDADVAALQEELSALKLAEEEFDLLEAIESEQKALEAMATEHAALEAQGEKDKNTKEVADQMVANLVTMGFSHEMACWAVQESKLEWNQALDLAFQRIQREEHEILEKMEKEEERLAKVSRDGRKQATPCRSTSMPPPTVPPAKRKAASSPKITPRNLTQKGNGSMMWIGAIGSTNSFWLC